MERIISRSDVKEMLEKWHNGEIDSKTINAWADLLYPNDEIEYKDWEGDNSVTNEILAALDMLDMNLGISEDASAYIDFLNTPIGDFTKGHDKFKQYLESINIDERKKRLSSNPFYESFC